MIQFEFKGFFASNFWLFLSDRFQPDRILLETSGSAFPASICWQIQDLASEGFYLDGLINVVDVCNFRGYEDTSYTAQLQTKYTDLILLNKWELASERDLDIVIDHVSTLNMDTPRLKCRGKTGVPKELLFGLDSKMAKMSQIEMSQDGNTSERLDESWKSLLSLNSNHHAMEVDLMTLKRDSTNLNAPLSQVHVEEFLGTLSRDDFFRVKGFLRLESGYCILNFAFGRTTWTLLSLVHSPNQRVALTVMGQNFSNGDLKAFQTSFQLESQEVELTLASKLSPAF